MLQNKLRRHKLQGYRFAVKLAARFRRPESDDRWVLWFANPAGNVSAHVGSERGNIDGLKIVGMKLEQTITRADLKNNSFRIALHGRQNSLQTLFVALRLSQRLVQRRVLIVLGRR